MHLNKLIHLICLCLLMLSTHTAATELAQGIWRGSLINNLGKRYEVQYRVSYATADEFDSIKIEMINLDLEPTPDYTYQLREIKLEDGSLSFEIPRKHDVRSCTLKKNNGEYVGECISDKAKEGETSQILMIAPEAETEPESELEADTEAESETDTEAETETDTETDTDTES